MKLTHDTKSKIIQANVGLMGIITLILYFDIRLLLVGICIGWLLTAVGCCAGLHKYTAHRAFEPRNRLCKHLLLLSASLCALGTPLAWSATHRLHHKTADHEGDPHRPSRNLWWNIRLWFYYFPAHKVEQKYISDLMRDSDQRFYHKYYFFIHFFVVSGLFLISPVAPGYFYSVPIMYVFFAISWITVLDHYPGLHRYFWRNFDSDDETYNSHILAILFPGDGYHNNHHAKPGRWNNAMRPGEFDLSAPFIKLLGKT